MRWIFIVLLTILAPFAAVAETVALPQACPAARMAGLDLPHVRAALARNHEVLIVALGSSSTQGWMSSDIAHSYPAVLQAALNLGWPQSQVAVINRGVGGQTTEQELGRLASDVLPVRPQLVIWQAGANDALRHADPARVRAALLTGVRLLRMAGIDVVLMDNQRSPRMMASPEDHPIDEAIAQVASETGAAMFARSALMDEWRAAGFGEAQFVAGDGLHENDRGYRCLAGALAEAIVAGVSGAPGRQAMQDRPLKGS